MNKKDIKDWANKNLTNWLNEKEINNLFDNDKLIECINNCTSPRVSDEKEPITEDDLKLIFKAFSLFEPKDTRVLILGQDPYPSKGKNEGRAHGLAFSFGENAKNKEVNDSLLNIFKVIKAYKMNKNFSEILDDEIKGTKDNEYKDGWDTNLEIWAKNNGILLLNTALTYCDDIVKEDRIEIWKPFIEKMIINLLKQQGKLVVFLWGDDAKILFHKTIFSNKDKNNIIDRTTIINKNLLVLSTSHPSENYNAYKKGFCYEVPNHFAACDKFLDKPIFKDFPENNKEEYYQK